MKLKDVFNSINWEGVFLLLVSGLMWGFIINAIVGLLK